MFCKFCLVWYWCLVLICLYCIHTSELILNKPKRSTEVWRWQLECSSMWKTCYCQSFLHLQKRGQTLTHVWSKHTSSSPRQKPKKVKHCIRPSENTVTSTRCVLCAVTLARALELGHKPSVVLALATETARTFTDACALVMILHVYCCTCTLLSIL